MKYAVIECNNSNFLVKAEYSNLNGAKVAFHDRCKILWNAPDVIKATVKIVNEQLDCVDGYMDVITHEVITDEQKSGIIEDSRG